MTRVLPKWRDLLTQRFAGGVGQPQLAATWFLRIGVAAACVGASWQALAHGTDLRRVADPLPVLTVEGAVFVDRVAGAALLALALLVVSKPSRIALGSVAAWFALLGITKTLLVGPFWYVQPGAAAIRYLAPIALMLLIARPARTRSAAWVMRVAVALTFAAHGFEALGRNPSFALLIEGTVQNLLGHTPAEHVVNVGLTVIGAVDVFVALLVLACDSCRAALGYMAVWGFVTAFSRVTAYGFDAWYEAFIRLPHAMVPLAALILIAARGVRQPTRVRKWPAEIRSW